MLRGISIVMALWAFLVVRRASACPGCSDFLDLRSTATRAGLVVVAHRTDSIISLVSDDRPWEAFATFEVEKVLKGSPLSARIAVAVGWLRDLGIEAERGRSLVLFLERRADRYYPVREGCAVRTLPVLEGKVVLSQIALPFDVFSRELGFAWAEENHPSWPAPVPLPVILCVACAGAGFALGCRSTRRSSR